MSKAFKNVAKVSKVSITVKRLTAEIVLRVVNSFGAPGASCPLVPIRVFSWPAL